MASHNETNISRFLPAEKLGWAPKGPDGTYDKDSLFDLIDGGAEVYRALNVRAVLNRVYLRKDAADIIVDIFDMGSSNDAFGAFHDDLREDEDVGVGHESEYEGTTLYFWKDRYFISIVALEDSEISRKAVLEFGKSIAAAIPNKGVKPDLVALLPGKGRVDSQLYYFHIFESLARRYAAVDNKVLGLSEKTEGLLARYRHGFASTDKTKTALSGFLLIRYPSSGETVEALRKYKSALLSSADRYGIAQTVPGLWGGARAADKLLVCVFDAPSKEEVLTLLEAIGKQG